MNPRNESKPESQADDDSATLKALELELIQKRASWQKARGQRNVWRTTSFIFLFLVVMGALFAVYWFMTTAPRKTPDQSEPAASSAER
jgi:hypothetical protein